MNQNNRKHTSWMTAITFAEAGEWDMAREYIPSGKRLFAGLRSLLEKNFMASAFAEEGLYDDAVLLATEGHRHQQTPSFSNFLDTLGLKGVRIVYGSLSPVELGVR